MSKNKHLKKTMTGIKAIIARMLEKTGMTFLNVLIALFIFAAGIIALVQVYPSIDILSGRAKTYISVSMIADRVFTIIQQVYGHESGPDVPEFVLGECEEFPLYSYRAVISEEKPGLYRVALTIKRKENGKIESESFYGGFRRR